MSQKLNIGGGAHAVVDMTFQDNGTPARRVMMGGQIIDADMGTPPQPTIAKAGKHYFYLTPGMEAVGNPDHVKHLPEPYRSEALAFIAANAEGGKPVKAPVTKNAAKAAKLAAKGIPASAKVTRGIASEEDLTHHAGARAVELAGA